MVESEVQKLLETKSVDPLDLAIQGVKAYAGAMRLGPVAQAYLRLVEVKYATGDTG